MNTCRLCSHRRRMWWRGWPALMCAVFWESVWPPPCSWSLSWCHMAACSTTSGRTRTTSAPSSSSTGACRSPRYVSPKHSTPLTNIIAITTTYCVCHLIFLFKIWCGISLYICGHMDLWVMDLCVCVCVCVFVCRAWVTWRRSGWSTEIWPPATFWWKTRTTWRSQTSAWPACST